MFGSVPAAAALLDRLIFSEILLPNKKLYWLKKWNGISLYCQRRIGLPEISFPSFINYDVQCLMNDDAKTYVKNVQIPYLSL